ncbi:MAG: hypothetical protein C4302_06410 [Thermus sp.]
MLIPVLTLLTSLILPSSLESSEGETPRAQKGGMKMKKVLLKVLGLIALGLAAGAGASWD